MTAGVGDLIKFEYDLANERMQIRYQANLIQRVWLVQKLIKKENNYTYSATLSGTTISSSVKTFRDLTENNNKDSNSDKDTGAY